ncbi:unnamed protein product [Blepharisma stoltei]|uniref:histidine ammonia-lyase n=1 Tax=Blepharisma stoltei TaxID=1481888 RepID=A0AAU9JM95_9CILI|nr:unnamed protein product [Blepharisma stoltei]
MSERIVVNGLTMTPELLFKLGQGGVTLEIAESAWDRVNQSRSLIDTILQQGKIAYGINTGFGFFANTIISPENLRKLQFNLIRSHSVGVGSPLPPERVRMLLALRINVLCKGFSGISASLLTKLVEAYNKDCLSYVPEQGTVGACGDLAPLAHLCLGLMGEGLMYDSDSKGYIPAAEVLAKKNYEPIRELFPKEGLSMINGAQMISALCAEALVRAEIASKTADVIASLSLDILKGTYKALDPQIHEARPHPGQMAVAARMRKILMPSGEGSELNLSHIDCTKVQDSYSLRCIPQVHGITHDTLDFVRARLTTELNSATDNPMIFTDTCQILSGGNFHGEYPAKLSDYLGIAIHEIGSISETRIQRLMNTTQSGLPSFLADEPGLNSGYMMVHCTAASLVSENKALCHPSSVDTIATSAGQEDHVSMGGWAARKAINIVKNVETILAIELLCDVKAMEFLRPLKSSEPLEKVISAVKDRIEMHNHDYVVNEDIETLRKMISNGDILNAVKEYIS